MGGAERATGGADVGFGDSTGEEADAAVTELVEGSIVAPPADIAHEGFGGGNELGGFVEAGSFAGGAELIEGGAHFGLHLAVAAIGAVTGGIKEEGAVGGFGGDGVVHELFGVGEGVAVETGDKPHTELGAVEGFSFVEVGGDGLADLLFVEFGDGSGGEATGGEGGVNAVAVGAVEADGDAFSEEDEVYAGPGVVYGAQDGAFDGAAVDICGDFLVGFDINEEDLIGAEAALLAVVGGEGDTIGAASVGDDEDAVGVGVGGGLDVGGELGTGSRCVLARGAGHADQGEAEEGEAHGFHFGAGGAGSGSGLELGRARILAQRRRASMSSAIMRARGT